MKRYNILRSCGLLMGFFTTSVWGVSADIEPRIADEMLRGLTNHVDGFNQTFFELSVKGISKTLVIKLEVAPERKEWDKDSVLSLNEFGSKAFGFVGNLNGNGYDVNIVKVDRSKNEAVIAPFIEQMPEAKRLGEILNNFKERPSLGVPHDLIAIKQNIVVEIENWLNESYEQSELVQKQAKFVLVLRQNGPLSNLQLACQKIVDNAKVKGQVVFHAGFVSEAVSDGKAKALKEAKNTKSAWQTTHKILSKDVTIMLGKRAKTLKPRITFISHEEEATKSNLDFFQYGWSHNEDILKELGKRNRAFLDHNGFTAVNIGATSSHVYWATNHGISNRVYRFGTKAMDQTKMRELVGLVQELNRPTFYFNAIGFAKVKGVKTKGAQIIDLKNVPDFELKDEKGAANLASEFAVELEKQLRGRNIPSFLYLSPEKKEKVRHRWISTLVHQFSEFEGKKLAFIVDFGGNSFSLRSVFEQEYEESQNLIEWYAKRLKADLAAGLRTELDVRIAEKLEVGLDKITGEQAIAAHYDMHAGDDVHPELRLAMDIIIEAAKEWLEHEYRSNEHGYRNRIEKQNEFNIVVRQSGRPRDRMVDSVKLIKESKPPKRRGLEEGKR